MYFSSNSVAFHTIVYFSNYVLNNIEIRVAPNSFCSICCRLSCMAEADIAPAYRTLCSHYSRGCSLLVRNNIVHAGRVTR